MQNFLHSFLTFCNLMALDRNASDVSVVVTCNGRTRVTICKQSWKLKKYFQGCHRDIKLYPFSEITLFSGKNHPFSAQKIPPNRLKTWAFFKLIVIQIKIAPFWRKLLIPSIFINVVQGVFLTGRLLKMTKCQKNIQGVFFN